MNAKLGADERSVILIGMRGAGKSTTGRYLAKALGGWQFVDADDAMSEREGMSPTQYASEKGMEAFRQREAEILTELVSAAQTRPTIIACGGGIVETEAGRAAVASGRLMVVHLRREWKDLEEDLTRDAGGRVPMQEPLETTWLRRLPHYEGLSELELWCQGGGQEVLIQAAATVRGRLRVSGEPLWRVGQGTTFVSWTLPSYLDVKTPPKSEGADAVELRADLLASGCKDHHQLRLEIAAVRRLACGLPIIFTVRSEPQGGKWVGSKDDYAALLNLGALCGCEILDVEACWTGLEATINQCHARGVGFIFSEHRMQTAPTIPLLVEFAQGCRALAPSVPAVIKIVMAALTPEHCDLLRQFSQMLPGALAHLLHPKSPGCILLLVGPKGRLSRLRSTLLTPCAHSEMASAAPGQLTVPQLSRLRSELGLIDTPSRLCLFGTPISASPSPAIHNAALIAAGCDAYIHYDLCETSSVSEVLEATRSPSWAGGNVTIPLKEKMFAHLEPELCTSAARAIGAVNTIWRCADGRIGGDNTDWRAVYELCRPHFVAGGVVCILGAGGTASAALYAARQLGASQICIVNRTLERAQSLASFPQVTAHADFSNVPPFQLLISCVPGTAEVSLPETMPELACVFEAAYKPRQTRVLEQIAARQSSATVIQGWQMLLEQGKWGWMRWLGRQQAPEKQMLEEMQKCIDGK